MAPWKNEQPKQANKFISEPAKPDDEKNSSIIILKVVNGFVLLMLYIPFVWWYENRSEFGNFVVFAGAVSGICALLIPNKRKSMKIFKILSLILYSAYASMFVF